MTNNTCTTADTALADASRVQDALRTARTAVTVYGGLSAVTLLAVVAVAGTGHTVSPFMWIRAVLLPVVAVPVYRLVVSASRGSRRAFERVRALAAVMPVAIVGIDVIPGVCPAWYAAAQAVCMAPVAVVAFLTRRPVLRAAFPRTR